MNTHILEKETVINKPLAEVFEFFSKAENLDEITPPHLHLKILTPLPIIMKPGALIQYQIKLFGIPFKWKTKITVWEPPYRFVDEQLEGPYKKWVHEHIFIEKDGKVLMKDKIEFLSPGWFLESFINSIFVERNVRQIFEHREKVLKQRFG